jgi:hypothetical protein
VEWSLLPSLRNLWRPPFTKASEVEVVGGFSIVVVISGDMRGEFLSSSGMLVKRSSVVLVETIESMVEGGELCGSEFSCSGECWLGGSVSAASSICVGGRTS